MSDLNQAVHAKTTRSHVTLHEHSSGAKSSRGLFKGSKDSASLVLQFAMKQKFFG